MKCGRGARNLLAERPFPGYHTAVCPLSAWIEACRTRTTACREKTVRVEDEYLDVLQNIESGIVMTYRDNPDMSDYDVMRALEAVIDSYVAEKIGRAPKPLNLSDIERALVENVRTMCEWRLGRGPLGQFADGEQPPAPESKTVDEIILCLKRILKSVKKWNKWRGRQGYLNFVIEYVG